MRPRGKLTVLLTALALFLGLAGCWEKAPESAFDAKTYVEGRLAEAYLGETSQEYMDLVGYNEVQVENLSKHSLPGGPVFLLPLRHCVSLVFL